MNVTQSKKSGKFSFTQLEESDLVTFHNILSDISLKYEIRLAILKTKNESLPEDEKLTDEEEINEYWQEKGLKI